MNCPTCGHEMSSVASIRQTRRIYWCPRCGTLRREETSPNPNFFGPTWLEDGTDHVPFIVERCRGFAAGWYLTVGSSEENRMFQRLRHNWKSLGISECLTPSAAEGLPLPPRE